MSTEIEFQETVFGEHIKSEMYLVRTTEQELLHLSVYENDHEASIQLSDYHVTQLRKALQRYEKLRKQQAVAEVVE